MKKLGFGCMRLPKADPNDRSSIDYDKFSHLVDLFIAEGFNYFDTAYKYCGGNSEVALRKCLIDRYPRESYILTTKLSNEFMKSKQEQEDVFQDQLKRLNCGYFDYYLLHNQGVYNLRKSDQFDSFAFAQSKKEAGLVKNIGMSWHDSAELLDQVLTAHPELDVVQLQLNYLDWDNETIQSRKCYEVCVKHGKKVFVMEPIKGGTLVNVPEEVEKMFKEYHPDLSVASWAIRFAASHENVAIVLSGMNEEDQVLDNTSYMKDFIPMNEEELAICEKAAKIIQSKVMIPCTKCRYCTETCPKNIPIPDYFQLVQEGHTTTQLVYYFNMTQTHSRAGDCIQCHQCEKHCPQHIKIVDLLKDISAQYDGFKGW